MTNFKEIFKYTKNLSVLYIEDDYMLLGKTSDFLDDFFSVVVTAKDGEEGLEQYINYQKENNQYVDLVITDINMPKKDGITLVQDILDINKEQCIIVVSAYDDSERLLKLIDIGIANFLVKPIEMYKMAEKLFKVGKLITDQKNLKFYHQQLEDLNIEQDQKIKEQYEEILYTQKISIHAIADMVENYDDDTGNHVKRIEAYTKLFLDKFPDINSYPKETISLIPFASLLHDIGKLMIPKSILTKPSKLTDEEFNIIKTHAKLGGDILKSANNTFKAKFDKDSYLKVASDIAMYHHERYDGKGYPYGLEKDEIPLCARVVAVADVYDALRSKRCYKDGFSHEKSMDIIKSESGKAFDPVLVDIFMEYNEQFDEIFQTI
jgi:putative two-component system response regulator